MKSYLIILTALFMAACGSGNRFEIKGTLTGLPDEPLYLEELTGGQPELLDSTRTDEKGLFTLTGSAVSKGLFRIRIADKTAIDVVAKNGDKIGIKGRQEGRMVDYEVSGSPESAEIKKINRIMLDAFEGIHELENAYMNQQHLANQDSLEQALDAEYLNIVREQTSRIKDYIRQNQDPVLKVYAVNYLDPETDLLFMDSVAAALKNTSGSAYIDNYIKKMGSIRALSIGQIAPEINLPTPDGRMAALSSLRGNYVLLNFWASWCGPCRKDNPELVRIFNKFKDRGFMIYAVSLDREKKAWEQAIMQDGLTWLHVSDLKFWDSEAARLYRIETIPANLLLDKEGKIVARNLHGTELEAFLDKLFR